MVRRFLAAFCVCAFLSAVPVQAYEIRKYDCDVSQGFFGFVQDYVAHNGSDLIQVIISLIPRFFRSDKKSPEGDLVIGLEEVGAAGSVLTVGAGLKTNLRFTVNGLAHFFCFEIAPSPELVESDEPEPAEG